MKTSIKEVFVDMTQTFEDEFQRQTLGGRFSKYSQFNLNIPKINFYTKTVDVIQSLQISNVVPTLVSSIVRETFQIR